ncbi:MAG: CGGC domain-containing protein [Dysgonomonas sp.]
MHCQQTEDMCTRSACFKVATPGKLAFSGYGECGIAGFVTCGGCTGKEPYPVQSCYSHIYLRLYVSQP